MGSGKKPKSGKKEGSPTKPNSVQKSVGPVIPALTEAVSPEEAVQNASLRGESWIKKNRDALLVQIIGGFVGGLIVLLVGIWLASGKRSDYESKLPKRPLGSFLGFVVVKAGSETGDTVLVDSERLEIRSGGFDVKRKKAVVSWLSVSLLPKKEVVLYLRNAELGGDYFLWSYPELNCGFRIDVLSSDALIENDQYILSVESWSLSNAEGAGACSENFS